MEGGQLFEHTDVLLMMIINSCFAPDDSFCYAGQNNPYHLSQPSTAICLTRLSAVSTRTIMTSGRPALAPSTNQISQQKITVRIGKLNQEISDDTTFWMRFLEVCSKVCVGSYGGSMAVRCVIWGTGFSPNIVIHETSRKLVVRFHEHIFLRWC